MLTCRTKLVNMVDIISAKNIYKELFFLVWTQRLSGVVCVTLRVKIKVAQIERSHKSVN